MASVCYSDDPLPWHSLPGGIDKTIQMMADSGKELADFDLKALSENRAVTLSGHEVTLSGQATVASVVAKRHDAVYHYQSMLLELEKLRSQQLQTNFSR
jgi:hypothetical protein